MQAALQATQTYLAALASALAAWSEAAAQAAAARDDRLQAAERTYAQRLQDLQSQVDEAWQVYASALLNAGCVANGYNPIPLYFVQHSLNNPRVQQFLLEEEARQLGMTVEELKILRAAQNTGQLLIRDGLRKAAARNIADSTAELTKDIAEKIKRFTRMSLREQIKEYTEVLRTYREHLQKYRQVEGRTTGETNRLERELQHMRNILRERGREFGPEGNILK